MDARRLERVLCFILAVGLWILADVAPMYHTTRAVSMHDFYTGLGTVAFVWGIWLPSFANPTGKLRRLWKPRSGN